MAFLTGSVGKKIPTNKINILILSKSFHTSIEHFFSEFFNFVVKSLIGPIEHHAKLSYINYGEKSNLHNYGL